MDTQEPSSSSKKQRIAEILSKAKARISNEQDKLDQAVCDEVEELTKLFNERIIIKELKEGEKPKIKTPTEDFGNVSKFVFSPSPELLKSLGFENLKRHPNLNLSRKSTDIFDISSSIMNNFGVFMHSVPLFLSVLSFQPVFRYMDTVSLVTLLDSVIKAICSKSELLDSFFFRIDEVAKIFKWIIEDGTLKEKKKFSRWILDNAFPELKTSKNKKKKSEVQGYDDIDDESKFPSETSSSPHLFFSGKDSERVFIKKLEDLDFSNEILSDLTNVSSTFLSLITKDWGNKKKSESKIDLDLPPPKFFVEDMIESLHENRAILYDEVSKASNEAIQYADQTGKFPLEHYLSFMKEYSHQLVNIYSLTILTLYKECSKIKDFKNFEVLIKNMENSSDPDISLAFSRILGESDIPDEASLKFSQVSVEKIRSVQVFCQMKDPKTHWDERTLGVIQKEMKLTDLFKPSHEYTIGLCKWLTLDPKKRSKVFYENRFKLFSSKAESMEIENPEKRSEEIVENRLIEYQWNDLEGLPELDLVDD